MKKSSKSDSSRSADNKTEQNETMNVDPIKHRNVEFDKKRILADPNPKAREEHFLITVKLIRNKHCFK